MGSPVGAGSSFVAGCASCRYKRRCFWDCAVITWALLVFAGWRNTITFLTDLNREGW